MASAANPATAILAKVKSVMRTVLQVFMAAAVLMVVQAAAQAEMLKGAKAQASPQADAFLAYETALQKGGLEVAEPYMTPAKVQDLQAMKAAFGEDGFQEFLRRMKQGAQGEARRKQILSVDIQGTHAVLEARDDPHTLTVQHLDNTADGWKVGVQQ